jgi:hypothetical protein
MASPMSSGDEDAEYFCYFYKTLDDLLLCQK